MSKNRRKRDARERSEQLYKKFEADASRIDAEKVALRRIEIAGGDEVALGCKSSGWPEDKENAQGEASVSEGSKNWTGR